MEVTSTNPVNLQNGVVNFTLRDTIKQTGLTFTVSDGFGKNVFSQPFTIIPDTLNYLFIYSGPDTSGMKMSLEDTILTTDSVLVL